MVYHARKGENQTERSQVMQMSGAKHLSIEETVFF